LPNLHCDYDAKRYRKSSAYFLSLGGKKVNNQKENNFLNKNQKVLYQVSLLQGLTYGDYKGSVTIKELKEHGDIGIGTFDKLNGELIMVDGVVYRALGNGSVEVVFDNETVPFAMVTYMTLDESKNLQKIADYETLCDELNKIVKEKGVNRFYFVRIDGTFNEINVRSVYAQKEPYKRLVEVMDCDQTFFDYKNIEGTLVGLYCPPFMAGINAVGWHLHFISKDKRSGGHLLGLNIANAKLTLNGIDGFEIRLPQNKEFQMFDFSTDQSEDIKKIETNKSH